MTPHDEHRRDDDVPPAMSYEELEHELKTPLTSMRSIFEILRDHPDLTDAQRRAFIEAVLAEEARLQRTIERLLGSEALQRAVG